MIKKNFLFKPTLFLSLLLPSLGVSAEGTDNLLSASEVFKHAQATVEIFLDHAHGSRRIEENSIYVGSLTSDKENKGKVYIDFRGARNMQENLSCIATGTGDIHQGFWQSYQSWKILKPFFFSVCTQL